MSQEEGYVDKLFANLPPEIKKWAIEQVNKDGAAWLGLGDAQIIAEYHKSRETKKEADKDKSVSGKPKKKKAGKSKPKKKKDQDGWAAEILSTLNPSPIGGGSQNNNGELPAPSFNPAPVGVAPATYAPQNNRNLLMMGIMTLLLAMVFLFMLEDREYSLVSYKVEIGNKKYNERNEESWRVYLTASVDGHFIEHSTGSTTLFISSWSDKIRVIVRNDGQNHCSILITDYVWKFMRGLWHYIDYPDKVTILVPNKIELDKWTSQMEKLQSNYRDAENKVLNK